MQLPPIPTTGHRLTVQVDGIMYCQTHDDFAIEGYDWSDICHEAWGRGDDVVEVNRCDLVPMFVEVTS